MFQLGFVQKCADEIKSILTIPEEGAPVEKEEEPENNTETKSTAKLVAMPASKA